MDYIWETIKNIEFASVFNVSPDLQMLYDQICIMKCYFCLYIIGKEDLEPFAYTAYSLVAFYKSYIIKKVDPAWFVTILYIFLARYGVWFTFLDMTTLLMTALSLKGFEFLVDILLIAYLHLILSRFDIITFDFKKTGAALLWIAVILSLPYNSVLISLANHNVFIFFFIAGTFYVGLQNFPEGRWPYLLLVLVFYNKDVLERFCYSLTTDLKIPFIQLYHLLT